MLSCNDPAFPCGEGTYGREGISIRIYIATAALKGLLSQAGPPAKDNLRKEDFAEMAVEYADALIERLEEDR